MTVDDIKSDGLKLESLAPRWTAIFAVLGVAGLAVTLGSVYGMGASPERFFRSYLLNFSYFLSFAIGGLFFVLISHLARASWSVVLRRIAEVLAWGMLPMALASIVILFGIHELYEWSHLEVVAHDELLQHKQPWLNDGFFIGRIIFYFLLWNVMARFFLSTSVKQDTTRDASLTLRMERFAAPATILFALSVTYGSFDLIMSLYPHWYSTIFGVYFFGGCVLAVFSAVTLMVAGLQRSGKLNDVVSVEHYHDLGKMMFAFVVFWAYIAFSQYMLIWYANVPEETQWYLIRQSGGWVKLSVVLLFGHFFVPFCWLLSRHMKRNKLPLVLGAVWVLAVHWLDLYYLIMPELTPEGPTFHLLDLGCFLLIGGFMFAAVFWRLGRAQIVPVGDPRLSESVGLESA